MGSIDVGSFRNAATIAGNDGLVTFDADKGGIGVERKMFDGFEVVQSPVDKQHCCEVRALLLNALSRDIGAERMANTQMKAFFENVVKRLLGDGGAGPDAVCYKPLSAREVRDILDQAAFMKVVATADAFASENADLVKLTDASIAELKALKGKPGVDAEEVDRAIVKFQDDRRQVLQDVENGGNSGMRELKAVHERLTAATGRIRTRAQIQEFQPKLDAAIEKFSENWSAQVGGGSKAVADCGARVKEQLVALKDQFLNEMRGIAANENPSAEELADVRANHLAAFVEKLSFIQDEGSRLTAQAKTNAVLIDRNADRLSGEMDALKQTFADLGAKFGDVNARTAFEDWSAATFKQLDGSVSQQLTKSGVVSPGTLQDATRQIHAFAEAVTDVIGSFNGTAEELQAKLESLRAPTVRITSVDQDMSNQRLMEIGLEAGVGPELAMLDSTAAKDVKAQFKSFNDAAKGLFKDFQKAGDLDAARTFEAAMKKASAKIEEAVVAALKGGVDLTGGIGGLFRQELDALAKLHHDSISALTERNFGARADESVRKLETAVARASNPKEKKALAAGAAKLRQIVGEKKAQLAQLQAGKGATPASAAAVAAEIDKLATTFLAAVHERYSGADDAVGKIIQGFARIQGEAPKLGDSSEAFRPNDAYVNCFAAANEGAFADVEALKTATTNEIAFQKTYGGALEGVKQKLTALVESAMLEHAGSEKYVSRDGDGNVTGLNEEGARLRDETVAEANKKVLERLRALPGGGKPVSADDVMALTAESTKQTVAARLNLSMVEEEAVEVQEQSLYPKGRNLFGLDLANLTPQQKDGLSKLAGMLLMDSVRGKIARGEMTMDDVLRQRTGSETMAVGFADVEKALWRGDFDLANVTGRMRVVLNLMINGGSGNESGETQCGFGTKDVSKIMVALADSGLPMSVLDDLPDNRVENVGRLLGALFALNNRKGAGMDAMCLRVLGVTIREAVELGIFRDESIEIEKRLKNDPNAVSDLDKRKLALFKRTDKLVSYNTDGEKYWRAHFDPIAMATAQEARAVAFVTRQSVPTAAEKTDVLNARAALAKLGPNQETTVTFAGVPITFRRDAGNALSANVMMETGELKEDKNGNTVVAHGGVNTRRPVAVAVPADVQSFLAQLDDVIVNDVKTYGTGAVREILDAQVAADLDAQRAEGVADPKPTSSRTRQLAMNVLSGAAGLRTADLSKFSTAKLVDIAASVLSLPKFGDLSPAQRKEAVADQLKTEGAVLLNAEGTLELYAKMVNAPQETKEKVFVPDPPKVRKGETPAQARIRQLHEFASDLVQPHDTTGYDLDRRNGLTDVDIMRKTLLAHRNEVKMLLRDPKLIATFDLPGGNGAKLTGFKAALQELMDKLTDLYGKSASMDDFFGKIENGQADAFLDAAHKGLSKAADAALANLQGAFAEKLTHAFRQNMGSANEPLWKKSLDELANSSKINVDAGYGKFLMSVIGEYFSNMASIDRSRMASLVMRFANADSSVGEALGALLKGAGPILQKLMQGLPQSTLPADLQQAVADLKCNLAPIPEEAVRAYLLDMVAESGGRIEGITVTRSLGAASVGQAFLCRIKTPEHPEGEECVVKILRPDVQSRAEREEAFFNAKAKELGLGGMLKDRFDRIFEELDLVVESRNVIAGSVYDPGATLYSNPDVSSMKLYSKVNSTMNTLVLRKAPGDTFDNYASKVGKRAQDILANTKKVVNQDGTVKYVTTSVVDFIANRNRLARLQQEVAQRQKTLTDFITSWAYEAVFGKGFFHGDVHAGNVMTDATGLTVIDYGNVSRFTAEEQKSLMCMFAHASAKNPAAFLDYFAKLVPDSGKAAFKKARASLESDVAEIFSKGTMENVGKTFVATLQLMQNAGVEIPGSLFNLMQSMQRLDESVNLLNVQIEEIRSAMNTMEIAKPEQGAEPPHYVDKFFLNAMDDPELRIKLSSGTRQQVKNAALSVLMNLNPQENRDQILADVVAACEQGPEALNKLLGDLLGAVSDVENYNGIPIDEQLGTIIMDADVEELCANGNDEARRAFAAKLVQMLPTVYSAGLSETCAIFVDDSEKMTEPDTFADALGQAVTKGKPQLLKNFGVGNLIESGKLRSNMKRETLDEMVLNQRLYGAEATGGMPAVAGAKQRIAAYAADPNSGMLAREVKLAGEAGEAFVLPKDVLASFSAKNWATDPHKRQEALNAFAFNLEQLKAHMEKQGLGSRVEADPAITQKYAKAAAIGFFARHAVFEKSFTALSQAEFGQLRAAAGGNADLVAFLDALREQRPIVLDVKALQGEVDEMFALF